MMSIRSTISRTLLGRRGIPSSGAAFFQANVPFISSSSDRSEDEKHTSFVSIRNFTSPAYKRYQKLSKHGKKGMKPSIHAYATGIQEPSLTVARDMGKAFSEIENEPLVIIAEMGNHDARIEVLRRHIMAVDSVDYKKAGEILKEVAAKNREGLFLYSFPYKFGMVFFLFSGLYAFPMIFEINTAMWFNKDFVTMEIPPPDELDTALETGIWTWNWMEPIIGTATYTLVCFQLIRQQMIHLGIKPFTNRLLAYRTKNLCEAYPQYNKNVLHNFVKTDPMA